MVKFLDVEIKNDEWKKISKEAFVTCHKKVVEKLTDYQHNANFTNEQCDLTSSATTVCSRIAVFSVSLRGILKWFN